MRSILAALTLIGVVAACVPTGSTASAVPSVAPTIAAATSYAEFVTAGCAAFQALFDAIGNPDTGSGSEMSKALDAAVKAKNVADIERLAAASLARLGDGRRQAAAAAGWLPGSPVMNALDRLLAAYQMMIAARRTTALGLPGPSPDAAFEAAGGLAAWQAMLAAGSAISPRPQQQTKCPGIPVSL